MTQIPEQILSDAEIAKAGTIGFTEIGVSGFKSFAEETKIKLGNLTILAGANSSGKSSIMQPLLLMKQTLEAPYDPGPLLLDGTNVSFTSGDQLIAKIKSSHLDSSEFEFLMGTSLGSDISSFQGELLDLRSKFNWSAQTGVSLKSQFSKSFTSGFNIHLRDDMTSLEIKQLQTNLVSLNFVSHNFVPKSIHQERCFLVLGEGLSTYNVGNFSCASLLRSLIHIQGVRGNPERTYKTAAVNGNSFAGRFENYVASVIDRFQKENPEKLLQLQAILQKLGLTNNILAQRMNDTQIELKVGRVLESLDPSDMVNIADVGFGVSQVLPVIVALLVARPGQMVYVEQPEIHLHPRAQIALAEVFAEAASRGVQIVVETHSELFLLGIQTQVAEDKLDPDLVKLHWFTRNPDGSSKVTTAELDETGAFGDWPEDFGITSLGLENRYLKAAEAKLWNSHA